MSIKKLAASADRGRASQMRGGERVNQDSTTASMIADRIRQAIEDGRFPPGTQLIETQLAEQFNLSRGPVREGLQRLVQEGLLRDERNRGVFVVDLDEIDMVDVYLVRAAIERTAAEIVMRRRDKETLAELEDLLDRMGATNDWNAVSELDLLFHERLVHGSGSKRLGRIFQTLRVETRMCMQALRFAYPDPIEIVDEHHQLLAALRSGNEAEALHLLEAHMHRAVRDLARGDRGQ